TINEVDVFSVQDNYNSPVEPTASQTFSQYGLTNFEVQYWTGSAWAAVPGGTVTGNNLVWRQVTFSAVATSRIRIYVTNALSTWSRLTEVEAYTVGSETVAAPSAPTTLAAASPAVGQVNLTWVDTSSTETRFEIAYDDTLTVRQSPAANATSASV